MDATTQQKSVWVVAASDDHPVNWHNGYNAYCEGRGPGAGRNRIAGWLAAYHEEQAELAERAEARMDAHQFAYGLF